MTIVNKYCVGRCEVKLITNARRDEAGWEDSLKRMADQAAALANYPDRPGAAQ